MAHHPIGIDFGTTNSSVAIVRPDGTVQLGRFPFLEQITETYRSLLDFEQVAGAGPPPEIRVVRP